MQHLSLDHRRSFHKSLPGTTWGITSYFNPVGYKNRLRHFRTFRESSRRQGLRLIAVEAAFGDAPFELRDDDADIVVRVRTGSILWQKERLLNIALKHLPADCDKVVWADADILFTDPQWLRRVHDLLQRFMVVQPFTNVVLLSRNATWGEMYAEGMKSAALSWPSYIPGKLAYSGMPGFVCAARRDVLDRFGFYDKMILGGGDSVLMSAFFGGRMNNPFIGNFSGALLQDAQAWADDVAAYVRGSVGYTDGTIFHLWHGSMRRRRYIDRAQLIRDFDPATDIRLGHDGAWEWNSEKPGMHAAVKDYFSSRDEDGLLPQTDEEKRDEEKEEEMRIILNERNYYRQALTNIQESALYRLVLQCNRIVLALLPVGSARRRFIASGVRMLMRTAGRR